MEAVRKYIDAKKLMSIISLPEAFQNKKLEIIIMPVAEEIAGKPEKKRRSEPLWNP